MPLSEEKMSALPPKAQAFWRAAWAFVQKNKTEWVWIEMGTEPYKAWVEYFRQQDWEPFAIRQMRKGSITKMTMPTLWPEWFVTPT